MFTSGSLSRGRRAAVASTVLLLTVSYAITTARAADLQPPNGRVVVPTANQVLQGNGPFTISGDATDDVGVSRLDVAIRDRGSGQWLRSNGSWGAFAWLTSALGSPEAAATTWSFSFTGSPGQYTVGARARDTSGKFDPTIPWVRFAVDGSPPPPPPPPTPADLQPPNGRVLVPTANQVLQVSGPFTISGDATDDVGVSRLDVAIRDRGSGLWLRSNGSWGAFAWLTSALGSPEAAATTWSFSFTGSPGQYTVGARARDTSGKFDPTIPWVRFALAEPPPPPPASTTPNIVLVLTDDQRWDSLWAMPNVQSMLVAHGVGFTNGFVVDPLCCPSRAAILKGAYAHSTGVYNNEGPYSPFPAFDDRSTVATWLQAGGYRTALIGKYFNAYDESRASYVPPGWDRWVAFATNDVGGGKYYDYGLSIDGVLTQYGGASTDYSTDVLAGFADSFIRSADPTRPLFLDFTPYGPHEPATAAPRHANAFPNLTPYRPPSFDEADVSDKPAYIRAIPRLTGSQVAREDLIRRKQLQTLLSVDDAVGTIVQALTDTGRLANTMVVFMSDNGFAYGEHRWGTTGAMNKQVPYEESIRVPYVVRFDPLTSNPRTDANLVLNIDLAPTFVALAGVAAPGAEGRSLLPLLEVPSTPWRTDFLVEHHLTNVPSYCAVRDTTVMYVRYATGEEELYLLMSDPYELVNLATDPVQAPLMASMRTRVQELCNPPPPGYVFP